MSFGQLRWAGHVLDSHSGITTLPIPFTNKESKDQTTDSTALPRPDSRGWQPQRTLKEDLGFVPSPVPAAFTSQLNLQAPWGRFILVLV